MHYKVIVLALFLGLASALPHKFQKHFDFNRPLGGSRLGVFDGTAVDISKHPYLVSILQYFEISCAGVILSEEWVLTSGDCTHGIKADDLMAVAGANDGISGDAYTGIKVIQHPKYKRNSYSYDVALIKIDGSFVWGKDVANVSLPSANPEPRTSFMVAGWGGVDVLDDSYDDSSVLLQGKMNWLSNTTCSKYYKQYYGWDDSQACAYNEGKVTLCSGDEGAPFVKDGVVYGVFVGSLLSYWCTAESWPVILVDVLEVKEWIQQHTGL